MKKLHRAAGQFAFVACAAILLAACASKMEPAQKLIDQVKSAVTAAMPDAEKYVPDQLKDVQGKLADLQASFDKKDYVAVITGGPAVLASAQGLVGAASAKKTEVLQALNTEWAALAGSVPGDMTEIQRHIALLSKHSSRRMARGIDLPAAKTAMSEATSLWSKAEAAFASANLEEAVGAAKDAKTKLAAIADSIKLKLSGG